jgi:hypothetical protein
LVVLTVQKCSVLCVGFEAYVCGAALVDDEPQGCGLKFQASVFSADRPDESPAFLFLSHSLPINKRFSAVLRLPAIGPIQLRFQNSRPV